MAPADVVEWSSVPLRRAVNGAGVPSRQDSGPEARGAGNNGSPPPPGRRVRPPGRSGPVVTDRDRSILQWVGRHGVVTPAQVAAHFFARDGGTVGEWAAYRRLRKLEQMGMLRRDRTFWREAMVLRLTTDGARFADVDVRPARLVLSEIRHSLAVVDLLESLLAQDPNGMALVTEREIRVGRRRDLRADPTRIGTGRIPDAELHHDGQRIAVELDLTPKRSAMYEDILNSYMTQRYDAVWWYVPARVVPRLQGIVDAIQADDIVSVEPWEG